MRESIRRLFTGSVYDDAMDVSLRRYALYLVRWQLSTPILAVVLVVFAPWARSRPRSSRT